MIENTTQSLYLFLSLNLLKTFIAKFTPSALPFVLTEPSKGIRVLAKNVQPAIMVLMARFENSSALPQFTESRQLGNGILQVAEWKGSILPFRAGPFCSGQTALRGS